jgi:tetratricopeptide (TPR) repeat protein
MMAPLMYDSWPAIWRRKWNTRWPLMAAGLLIMIVIVKNVPPGIGWSVNQFSYPTAAVEFIQRERLTELSDGQLYNSYNFGGYLTWAWHPSKIFIDGRVRPYQGEITERYWNNFKGGEVWRDSIGQYNLTVALITHPHVVNGVVYNDVSRMFPKEQWALIYYDDVAAVYARRMPALKNVISRLEYQYLDPQMIDVSYLGAKLNGSNSTQRVLAEIDRSLALNPGSYRLHFNAAYVYGELGQLDRMRNELTRVLQINPHFEPAQRILDQLI